MDEVADWLKQLGLGEYAPVFTENHIDESLLPTLTDADLKEIGMASLGHRRRLLQAIAAMVDKTSPPTPAPIEVPVAPAERRQLTVMFCDLVGSTALSARLDPEDLHTLVARYHASCSQVISRYGGRVAQYLGDGIMAYFGYPQAHEDDAERAVRAALDALAAVRSLDVPEPLQVRIGIATGLVVTGEIGVGDAQLRGALGETPNLAARMQALADPDSVVIDAQTRRLLGELFEYRSLGPVTIKGFAAPLDAFAVLRPSPHQSRFEALHGSRLTPLVGRDDEIELMLRRWRQAKSREGQTILLSGEPGIGKSRLVAAFLDRVVSEPHLRLRYFCSPHHQDSALYPVIAQIERA
jgi:class 3 adenylate cyclase